MTLKELALRTRCSRCGRKDAVVMAVARPRGVNTHRYAASHNDATVCATLIGDTHVCHAHTKLGMDASSLGRTTRDRVVGQHEGFKWLHEAPLHSTHAGRGWA